MTDTTQDLTMQDAVDATNGIVLIEEHTLNGIEWVVSFNGSNPTAENAIHCTNYTEAEKLVGLLTRLREQVVAQQAANKVLRHSHDHMLGYLEGISDPKMMNIESMRSMATLGLAHEVPVTTDDLSALKAHDDALWNEALTTGIEWQATRGHTLDADDYENELRSLKR